MPGGHQQGLPRRVGLRWMAGALSVGIVGAVGAAVLATAGPANAAPSPNYNAGSDTATFTVTGVLDRNCLISTGGTEVWIKPGDKINFDSSLVGINIAALPLHIGGLAGLDVNAVIDGATAHPHSIVVGGGGVTAYPGTGQPALTSGDHTLNWNATGIPLLNGLLTLPLSSNALKSGASLSWKGVIHVTNGAPQCKISVGTPAVAVSVGPIKITIPPINVNIPVPSLPKLPALPNLPGLPGVGGGSTTTPGGGIHYTPPPLTVPEQAMGGIGPGGGPGGGGPGGGGPGGGSGGLLPNGAAATRIGTNLPQVPVAGGVGPQAPVAGSVGPQSSTDAAGTAKVITKAIEPASNKAPAVQLPMLLAIIAIIALSLVTATYARLYLLRRNG